MNPTAGHSGTSFRHSFDGDRAPRGPAVCGGLRSLRRVGGTDLLASRRVAAGFTMIEMLVVVGIIGLLLAIAVPTASRLIENQRRNTTMSNMQVIENAIDAYRRCKNNIPPGWFSIKDLEEYPGGEKWDPATQDPNKNKRWDSGEPFDYDDGDGRYEPVNIRIEIPGISGKRTFKPVARLRNGSYVADDYNSAEYHNTIKQGDAKSIEAMYLWMTQLCPESQQILSGLPSKRITNNDLCGGSPCPDVVVFDTNGNGANDQPYNGATGGDKTLDLFEIRDEWDVPLHYSPPAALNDPDVARRGQQVGSWELRSAGPDNLMGNADDVVLKGQ